MANAGLFEGLDRSKHGELKEFLTKIRSLDIHGKQVIQTPDGDFIEYVFMEESYFVKNWLAQFALGNVSGRNYFNTGSWNRITDGYTKGVIVLDENKEPVLVIRKFTDMDLNVNQTNLVEQYTRRAAQAANMPDKSQVDQVINSLTDILIKVTEQNPDYDTLTAMIPFDYYLSKGINPIVMKQVIYIRDNFTHKGLPISPEVLKEVEDILYKNSRAEKVTKQERALVDEITGGQFIFNGEQNKVDTNSSQAETNSAPFDPMAD